MLILSRKKDEKILIGNCRVSVVKVDRNQVRIGIEAPTHVPVYREEILPTHEGYEQPSLGEVFDEKVLRPILVFSRKLGEKILIGDCQITVVAIR